MITADRVNSVVRSNVQSEGKFTIKNCGKAFRILSDGLYSDKVSAIIRELSCNAYDAHIAGKNNKPFSVQLPNKLEPVFKIRDYGIGLSHHDIVNVYTTYFQSTKTDSNDYIGCLGLGSKSPFSYVDNFSIVSYFNGEKRMYNSFINEEDTPTIALLDTSKTNEVNGLEISFPVSGYDIFEFTEKAQKIYHYFKMKPEISGYKIEITSPKYIMQGKGWGIREKSNRSGAIAVMGNVAYSLSNFSSALEKKQNILKGCNIDIEFGIGELEVSASRESLSYNPKTVQNIKDRFDAIVKEISEIVSERIKVCTNLWEARVFAKNIVHGEMSSIKALLDDGTLTWQGHSVGQSFVELPSSIKVDISVFQPSTTYKESRTKIRRQGTQTITIRQDLKIFNNDLKTGSFIRCKQAIYDSAVNEHDEFKTPQVYLVSGEEKEIKALVEFLGINGMPFISSINRSKTSSVCNSYDVKNTKKMFVYDFNARGDSKDYWKVESIDTKAGGIYVVIDRYKILGQKSKYYMNTVKEHLQTVGVDLTSKIIVGVKSGHSEKLTGNWVTLNDYVRSEIEKYVVANKYDEKVSLNSKLQEIINKNNNGHSTYLNEVKFPVGSAFEIYKNEIKIIQEQYEKLNDEKLNDILKLAQTYSLKMDKPATVKLTYSWDNIMERYPMMRLIDSYWAFRSKENVKMLLEYVEMIEKNK